MLDVVTPSAVPEGRVAGDVIMPAWTDQSCQRSADLDFRNPTLEFDSTCDQDNQRTKLKP